MKLHILSDLHLGVQGMEHPQTDADIVVLAGDIARPAQAMAWAQGFGKPVLYHDKESRGALAYLALAGEMIRRADEVPDPPADVAADAT